MYKYLIKYLMITVHSIVYVGPRSTIRHDAQALKARHAPGSHLDNCTATGPNRT